jgi:hypothetical protein
MREVYGEAMPGGGGRRWCMQFIKVIIMYICSPSLVFLFLRLRSFLQQYIPKYHRLRNKMYTRLKYRGKITAFCHSVSFWGGCRFWNCLSNLDEPNDWLQRHLIVPTIDLQFHNLPSFLISVSFRSEHCRMLEIIVILQSLQLFR